MEPAPSLITLSLILLLQNGPGQAVPVPTQPYPHSVTLARDDAYHLFWSYTSTHITFEVHAKVKGWVGFGLSPTGGMHASDVVIGWVEDGVGFMHDRYCDIHGAKGRYCDIDESQDWELLSAMETETHTVLKMSRKLRSCDSFDRNITVGTIRVVFSYSDTDPVSKDVIHYHGATRGTKSLRLLGAIGKRPAMPTNITSIDIHHRSYTIPDKRTTYYCTGYPAPVFSQKHHLIKIEPIIQAGSEVAVHHIVLYACYHTPDNIGQDVRGFECYTENMPWGECSSILNIWAIGGGDFYYPEHVGQPFGTTDGIKYLRLEIHYDNPNLAKGNTDSSGLRLWFTKDLRKYDAGLLWAGIHVTKQTHILPAGYDNLIMDGHCSKECLSQSMGKLNEIKVFAAMLHTHTLGKGIRVHHYRDGVEQPYIDEDMNYDFNFQDTNMLQSEVTIKKGDNIVVECRYNTSGSTRTTFGGLGTPEEMCIAFMLYYPKIPIARCVSSSTQSQMAKSLELKYSMDGQTALINGESFDVYMETTDVLDTKAKKAYQKAIVTGYMLQMCQSHTKWDANIVPVPQITKKYIPKSYSCNHGGNKVSEDFNLTMILLLVALVFGRFLW